MIDFLSVRNGAVLRSYSDLPSLIKEHCGIEETVLAGGYGYRQILELVQNGADAILEAQEGGATEKQGRLEVVLSKTHLYVANTGAPLTEEGLEALLSSHTSPKRGNQIGRFGLGFKSLLRMCGQIDILSKTVGGIRFDPIRCQEEIQTSCGVKNAPSLRMAWPFDVAEVVAKDRRLSSFDWAETVVRVEIADLNFVKPLREEIRTFPAEFLLFLPVSVILTLDDGAKSRRDLRIETYADLRVLHVGDDTSQWKVVQREVCVTDAAAHKDATHIHGRDTVPLSWAIPLQASREEAGRFWAFFPTHTPTYLPGILNAPWKLNSDRNAIIAGEWNTFLMRAAAEMIVDSLPSLATAEDPGKPLDAFPRQLSRSDEDAAPLVEAVWNAIESAQVLPDRLGVLREPETLWRHPIDDYGVIDNWSSLIEGDDEQDFVHPSCLFKQRASRLKALADRITSDEDSSESARLQEIAEKYWFSCVATTDPKGALAVLQLAERFANALGAKAWKEVRNELEIIPTAEGNLGSSKHAVFAPESMPLPDSKFAVQEEVASDPDSRRILSDLFSVSELEDAAWRDALTKSLGEMSRIGYFDEHEDICAAFWSTLRHAPSSVCQFICLVHAEKVFVKRSDGTWRSPDRVLLPGGLVLESEPENRGVLVHSHFHAADHEILGRLGISARETCKIVRSVDQFLYGSPLITWRNLSRDTYQSTYPSSGARREYLEPFRLQMPAGTALLTELTGFPNARLTLDLIGVLVEEGFKTVQFGHSTRDVYPRIDVPHPLLWLLLHHGSLDILGHPIPISVLADQRHEPALACIDGWERLEPVLELIAEAYTYTDDIEDDVSALWEQLVAIVPKYEDLTNDSLHDLWNGAANAGVIPDNLPHPTGPIPLSKVYVTDSQDLAERALQQDRVVVWLDSPILKLWIEAGARDLSEMLKPLWSGESGPAVLLTDVFPEFSEVIVEDLRSSARCQQLTGLALRIDIQPESVPCLMYKGTLLVDMEQLVALGRSARLHRLLEELSGTGWLASDLESARAILWDGQVEAQRNAIAAESTLARRLLRAVGGRKKPLLDSLGSIAGKDFVATCSPEELAGLTLATHGTSTLVQLKGELSAEGLRPPNRWNTVEARSFVKSLGFPEEFAASPTTRREPEEWINGPISLPDLHDFQKEVLAGIDRLLRLGADRRRAVVSLPTGGGKTRVTVQAAVQFILKPQGDNRSVLWIAQTDELCEQAVQAFRQVWLNVGADRTDLRIVRLWGGNPNPDPPVPGAPVVVVASIQTLNFRMGLTSLGWLNNPGLVVVDECHHAITTSYSELLRWLDAEAQKSRKDSNPEPPIIGLSATPFRSDDFESQRLAKRFDSKWFPSDQQALHSRLLKQGVLAQAEHVPLPSESSLLKSEAESLSRMEDWEGLDFENLMESINRRLATDRKRNELIIDQITRAQESSILLFANSIEHSEELAARLHLAGVAAASISGNTPRSARRYFLEQFQRGELRVLCNHSVLTTGFDAPRTEMIFISRQVFSAVRYMQIVGRGLRGEKNGGTKKCKIVTVLDNLGRFADRHPYHYCARYFQNG